MDDKACMAHIKSLYESSKYSDITVELRDGEVLKLHKGVVCRLDFFRAACDGSFKEAAENHVKFPDEAPKAMKALFMSLYGYTSDEIMDKLKEANNKIPVANLLSTYDVATKYSMTCLAKMTCDRFDSWLGLYMLNANAIDNPTEKSGSAGWLWELTTELDDVQYEGSSLRAILVKGVQAQMAKTPEDEKFKRYLKESLLPCTNIAFDLLKSGGLNGKGGKLDSK